MTKWERQKGNQSSDLLPSRARVLSHHNSGWNTIFFQFLWRETWVSDEEKILMGKKFGKHVSYQAWYTHTDKSSLKPSVRFFTPYLGRKHICQYNLFHFLVAEASFVGSQNDTTEEQSLTSVFGEKTQARQHLCWGREKHWAIFQTKWTNKNAQSSHYRVSACLLISSGYVRWIKAKPDSYATRGKQSTCLGHFLMAFPDEKLQSTTVLALRSFVFVYCST